MAVLIPPKPGAAATPPVARMFRLLKRLGDEFTVRHLLDAADGPQFLVTRRDRHAFLIRVASTSQELAETALSPSFLPDAEQTSAENLDETWRFEPPAGDLPVRRLVVFPNVDDATIDQIERLRGEQSGVSFLGLKQTPADRFAQHLETLADVPLSEPMLLRLRERFDAGSRIRPSPARQPLPRRERPEELPPDFLDLDQETLAKLEVALPPEAARLGSRFDTRLVTGPAGCGKSLVLLHRALFAARLNRGARLLLLTHNKPINAELRRRAVATAPEGARIQALHFFKWARTRLPRWPENILPPRATEQRLAALMDGRTDTAGLTPGFVAEEIAYLRDLGIDDLDAYLAHERAGRLMALTASRRRAVWDLLARYRAELARRGESDWHEVALRFRDFARERPERLNDHDFIFIDEAQFFAKVWFEPVLAALRPGGQLFLAADPTQGFLKRRESWTAAGIEVRGRASRLSTPYRSTRAILRFARDLIERRRRLHPGVPDDLDPPTDADLAAIPEEGEPPLVLNAASRQDALKSVARELEKLRRDHPQLADTVLVLHADSFATGELVRVLRARLGDAAVSDLNIADGFREDAFCGVSNLMAATGLEAAVVFLLGIDGLLESEADPRLDPAARAERAADHTRLLYMACTRAARRLVIFSGRW